VTVIIKLIPPHIPEAPLSPICDCPSPCERNKKLALQMGNHGYQEKWYSNMQSCVHNLAVFKKKYYLKKVEIL
jgi:hypothetical protein